MYTLKELAYASSIIKRVALDHHVSEAQVRADMLEAMNAGRSSTDPAVQAKWRSFHFAGQEPTIEEFILWMSSNIDM